MKEYLCEQVYDNSYNKVANVLGTIMVGALGGVSDRGAEKYKIYINEEENQFKLIGLGYSAWGQLEEEKEHVVYNISEIMYQVHDDKIRIEIPNRVREFKIIKEIDS